MIEEKGKLFTIQRYTPSFEPLNVSFYKQHASMFKNDNLLFNPQKVLVLSIPHQFVANLKPGQFTSLDNWWLKNLNGILIKAISNSIKQSRLVRLLRTNYCRNCSITFRNSNEDVIYEDVINTNGSSFLVNLDQVYDTVGEEDWIHDKVNCHSNLASSQRITLSWGAKKKEYIQ